MFKILILNGPATGWGYSTAIMPDPVIAIAPTPREDEYSPRRWMRVPREEGDEPWPQQLDYCRNEDARGYNDDGDEILGYFLAEVHAPSTS